MSAYGDYEQPRRYHSTRTRQRDRDEPDFVREETYIERGKGPGPRDLVFRGRDDSIEDIPREFPPPAPCAHTCAYTTTSGRSTCEDTATCSVGIVSSASIANLATAIVCDVAPASTPGI